MDEAAGGAVGEVADAQHDAAQVIQIPVEHLGVPVGGTGDGRSRPGSPCCGWSEHWPAPGAPPARLGWPASGSGRAVASGTFPGPGPRYDRPRQGASKRPRRQQSERNTHRTTRPRNAQSGCPRAGRLRSLKCAGLGRAVRSTDLTGP